MKRLAGKTVVVTGAGRGLGKGVTLAMAMEGASLWICDKTDDELERTARLAGDYSGEVFHRQVDLREASACASFTQEILERSETVDCLVNNAGVLPRTPFTEVTTEEWESTLAINLTAGFMLCQQLMRGMAPGGGSFINVSSRAGVLGFAKQTTYCASKFAVEGMTRALAQELEPPYSANTITPGMRIKPTNLTEAEERQLPESERVWNDPLRIAPAFIYLSLARGRPNGRRFDAERLTEQIRTHSYDMRPEIAESIAE